MFVLDAYFCCVFYSEIQELTQILLRISEEKFGGWGLCFELFPYLGNFLLLA